MAKSKQTPLMRRIDPQNCIWAIYPFAHEFMGMPGTPHGVRISILKLRGKCHEMTPGQIIWWYETIIRHSKIVLQKYASHPQLRQGLAEMDNCLLRIKEIKRGLAVKRARIKKKKSSIGAVARKKVV